MSPQEIETLRQQVDRDVHAVVTACAPYWWKDGDFKEAKETLGCIHPVEKLLVTEWVLGRPVVACELCGNNLDKEVVAVRLNGLRQSD